MNEPRSSIMSLYTQLSYWNRKVVVPMIWNGKLNKSANDGNTQLLEEVGNETTAFWILFLYVTIHN